MITLAELVRMPIGTMETYMLNPHDEPYFIKKLATYALRVKAKVTHDSWICVRKSDHAVQEMVVCKVVKQGKKLKRKRKKQRG